MILKSAKSEDLQPKVFAKLGTAVRPIHSILHPVTRRVCDILSIHGRNPCNHPVRPNAHTRRHPHLSNSLRRLVARDNPRSIRVPVRARLQSLLVKNNSLLVTSRKLLCTVAEKSSLGGMCVNVAQAVAVLPLKRLNSWCLRSCQMRVGVGWSQLNEPLILGNFTWVTRSISASLPCIGCAIAAVWLVNR